MKTKNFTCIGFLIIFLLNLNLASAVIIDSVEIGSLYPGESSLLRIEVKNIFQEDVEQVSLVLNLENTDFTTIGSSEDSQEKIKDGDKEIFNFNLKASNNLIPGDHNVPYTITYIYDDGTEEKEYSKTGSFGVSVGAKTDLDFSIETSNNIVERQGRITLEIINRGLGELKSVQVKVNAAKTYELISPENIFVGNIDGEDSERINFDVIFKEKNVQFSAQIHYKDFNNQNQIETINLPVKVYSVKEAKELGIIQQNNFLFYIFIVIILLVLFFVWKKLRKKKKKEE